ncbi:MAG: NAD(P)/FAD-dependent oxidoreductase [Alphaproteobacteria bacterium]
MSQGQDVIVIGAGITGASTAYHLKKRGVGRVLLLEREQPASGGTGKSAAIIRQHYSTPLLVRLARASIDMLAAMAEELGRDGGYVGAGYCFLVPPALLEGARRNVAMQQSLGIETVLGDAASQPGHLPEMAADGIAAIVYERLGGYADPVRATEAYVAGFERLGGTIARRTAARALLRCSERVHGVLTDGGAIEAGWVVNAAGPWAGRLAATAGIDLSLSTFREQDTVWEIPAGRPIPDVSVSNGAEAIYLRPLGGRRFVIGRGFPKPYVAVDPANYKLTADADFIADIQARAVLRFPAFAGMRLVDSYAALYDVTPDWNPFVGPRAGLAGYADACGGSGHGFKIAPALGRELAGWIVDGTAADDFRQFSHDRLAAGQLFTGAYGGNRA